MSRRPEEEEDRSPSPPLVDEGWASEVLVEREDGYLPAPSAALF